MKRNIDQLLREWEFKPGMVQARLVQAGAGRQVLQMRVDLGIMQLETTGRPDGTRPNGFLTFLDYVRHLARQANKKERQFVLNEEHCEQADREFTQFYYRRLCWMALREFGRAVADSDHTLTFMDFLGDHSPTDQYRLAHEQYRGLVLFHRTQAAAAVATEADKPEDAIDVIRVGLRDLQSFFADHGMDEYYPQDQMVKQLQKMDRTLRKLHEIDETIHERLEKAIANEEYEVAAKLRDQIRERQ